MDDALSLSRSQGEESQAARMIYSTAGLYGSFIRYGAAAGSRGHGVTGSAAASCGHGVSCRVRGSAVGLAAGSRGQLWGQPWGHGVSCGVTGTGGQLWAYWVSCGVTGSAMGSWGDVWGHEVVYGVSCGATGFLCGAMGFLWGHGASTWP